MSRGPALDRFGQPERLLLAAKHLYEGRILTRRDLMRWGASDSSASRDFQLLEKVLPVERMLQAPNRGRRRFSTALRLKPAR